MSQTAFFAEHQLPVFDYLSPHAKEGLENYIREGNTSFRQKKLLEFFKMLDWVSIEEAVQDRILQKLSPNLRKQIYRDIHAYHLRKAATRVENAEKREQYKLRIIEYFRARVPASDKALLESLRDYELDLTGRDVNWRHYFTLDSFKRIDAFVQAEHLERQELFARFKKDVDTYKKNLDKLQYWQESQASGHGFSFDDWCEMMGDEVPRSQQKKQQTPPASPPTNPVAKAYQTLQVPLNTAPEIVKKQFRQLTLQHHPDLPNGNEEKMKAIVGAYQELQRYWATCNL